MSSALLSYFSLYSHTQDKHSYIKDVDLILCQGNFLKKKYKINTKQNQSIKQNYIVHKLAATSRFCHNCNAIQLLNGLLLLQPAKSKFMSIFPIDLQELTNKSLSNLVAFVLFRSC